MTDLTHRCDGITWRGLRCTRLAIKHFPDPEKRGAILHSCGQTHGRPDVSKKIERNAPCSCGSGRKYKRCCFLFAFKSESEIVAAAQWQRKVEERQAERNSTNVRAQREEIQ